MEVIADLHMHGKYSRATSKDLTLTNIEKYARQKGLSLVGTGDFTHPKWIEEISSQLQETSPDSGIYQTTTGFPFLLQTEISLVYSQGGRGYRTHNLILAPNLEAVKNITTWLLTKGRVDYDGRPIFKIPCPEFVESLRAIDERIEIIPAHIWTPWFSLFGSKSGFNSVNECFGDQVKYIHALETGISSDPAMNWRVSQLDRFWMVSFSDSHSFWPWRMGREATRFELHDITYQNLITALRTGHGFRGTIETSPNYGKYHVDGHRACGVMLEPAESNKIGKICPKCKQPLTIGVLNRVEELADRPIGYVREDHPGFVTLLPLSEIIAAVTNCGLATKTVFSEYYKLLKLGTEFDILLNKTKQELETVTYQRIAEAIIQIREGKVTYIPGYDGVYGKVLLKSEHGEHSAIETSKD